MPRSEGLSRRHHAPRRDGINPGAAPRMAAQNATEREPAATRCAVLVEGLEGVGRTGRPVATGGGAGRREGLVPEHQPAEDTGHVARSSSAPTASATAA